MVAAVAPEALLTISKWRYNWNSVASQPTSTPSSFIKIHVLKIQENTVIKMFVYKFECRNEHTAASGNRQTYRRADTSTVSLSFGMVSLSQGTLKPPWERAVEKCLLSLMVHCFSLENVLAADIFLGPQPMTVALCITATLYTSCSRYSAWKMILWLQTCLYVSIFGLLELLILAAGESSIFEQETKQCMCASILAHPSVAVQIEKLPLPNFIWKWTSLPPLLFYACKSIVGQVWASGMHLGSEDAWLSVVLGNEFMALHVGTSLVIYAQIIGLKSYTHNVFIVCIAFQPFHSGLIGPAYCSLLSPNSTHHVVLYCMHLIYDLTDHNIMYTDITQH